MSEVPHLGGRTWGNPLGFLALAALFPFMVFAFAMVVMSPFLLGYAAWLAINGSVWVALMLLLLEALGFAIAGLIVVAQRPWQN